MNNGNIDEKILNLKIAIVLFRIMYILVFILSILMILVGEDGEGACIGFGVFGLIIAISNLLIKSYFNKLSKVKDEQNSEYQKRAKEIMEERQRVVDDINKNTNYEIDDIVEYLNYMFEIKDLRLEKEYKSEELNRVLYKVPGDRPIILEIEKNLKAEQELVGGLIEAVDFTDNTCLICNEEGKLQALMPNLKYGREFIVGNVFVIGCTEDGEFRSLTDKEIEECVDKLNEMDINKKQLFEEEEM